MTTDNCSTHQGGPMPTTLAKDLAGAQATLEAAKRKVEAISGALIKDSLKRFFAEHPNVRAVKVKGYYDRGFDPAMTVGLRGEGSEVDLVDRADWESVLRELEEVVGRAVLLEVFGIVDVGVGVVSRETFEEAAAVMANGPDHLDDSAGPTSKQVVLITGNPVDGLRFFGPFITADGERANGEGAMRYAETELPREDWWIADLQIPEEA